ncbi:MAG: glycosyltransferase family 4 protein, partial [Deltaproteobacteria bacterium]|nr:glycosyltransferase family 4 protein [Deltaproteobacteria bacterium]
KKKITLVADTPGWAYDNISRNIRKHLGDTFDIRIVHVVDYTDFDTAFLDLFCLNETDYIHFFWREYLFAMIKSISPKTLASHLPFECALDRFCEKIITLSIYDHLYLSPQEIADRQGLFAITDAYSVCSKRLFSIYAERFDVPPDVVIEDGVDPERFPPKRLERFLETDRELVVGWAGNSRWHFDDAGDPKGLHTILKPAIARLRQEGISIRGSFADVSESIRPRSEMPDFYNSLDVLVCASAMEGTPNPVLEAMACGVPIVSTDVGIVPQVFGPLQSRFLLPERSVEAMAEKLRELAKNRLLLPELSRENLSRIREWTWAGHMTKWMLLFKIASFRYDTRAIHRKRRFLLSLIPQERRSTVPCFKEILKKTAYRVHPDTLFWRNMKNRAMKPWRRIRNGRSND